MCSSDVRNRIIEAQVITVLDHLDPSCCSECFELRYYLIDWLKFRGGRIPGADYLNTSSRGLLGDINHSSKITRIRTRTHIKERQGD